MIHISELTNVRKGLIESILKKEKNVKLDVLLEHSNLVLFSTHVTSQSRDLDNDFEQFLKCNNLLFPVLEWSRLEPEVIITFIRHFRFRLDDDIEGKKFGEYLFDLKLRNLIGSDQSWKLFEKLKKFENCVWTQLLKSRLSAIT